MNHFKIFIDGSEWKCSPNLINWSRLQHYLVVNGHTIVQDPKQSDYIVINSCGALNTARTRTYQLIQQYQDLKEKHQTILLFGCLVDIDRQEVESLGVFPIGLHDNQKLDAMFYRFQRYEEIERYYDDTHHSTVPDELQPSNTPALHTPIKFLLLDFYQFLASIPLILFFPSAKKRYHQIQNRFSDNVYVEISTGCTGSCNYCTIKRAKGIVQSRDIQDILADIEQVYHPPKALCLVADDCGCFGVDTGTTIIQLLDSIHRKFPEIPLRLNYVDPKYLMKHSSDFLRIFRDMNVITTIVPLQSGSPEVLKKMNRSYHDATTVVDLLEKIRDVSPETIIISQFIVGHPGETWYDFLKTLAVARHFDYPVPIEYSNNKNTVSSKMADQVSPSMRSLRQAIFIMFLNVIVFFRMIDTMKKD